MTLPWIITGAAAGLISGPRIRASVFYRGTGSGQPPRRACPACARDILPDRGRRRSLLPVTGRCLACRARIGPPLMLAGLAAGLALALAVGRTSSALELAVLAWLILLAVPPAFIDVAVRRLPDPLTAAAFTGVLVMLAIAALTSHQPGHFGRAVIGAGRAHLLLSRPGPDQAGRPRCRCPKLAASIGAVLALTSGRAPATGTFTAFALAAIYGSILIASHKADRGSHLPLGPFLFIGALAAITF